MITIAVVNMKGGSAKSSTCYHLGGMLARRGKKVLLVDNDPQSSLTQGFWGPVVLRDLDPSRTVDAVYRGDPLPEDVIHETGFDNLRILPGHEQATEWNMLRVHEWGELPMAMGSLLAEAGPDHEYCLIDCPPNLHLCTFAALMAADFVLVPLQAEDFGAQGMVAVNRAIATVQGQRGGRPRILGYLLTMYQERMAVHQAYASKLRGVYAEKVFATAVPRNNHFAEAVASRTPLSHFKKSGVAWKAIAALADEVDSRMATAEAGPVEDGRAA